MYIIIVSQINYILLITLFGTALSQYISLPSSFHISSDVAVIVTKFFVINITEKFSFRNYSLIVDYNSYH